ncbi:glycosyltransferase family 2 protein [Brevundimonas sp.]|uniref:glycosyltransferase family 2 protein n=1 Tax=Brevundimonas sp. TaxID=1871086 RepID=UPI003918905F
MHDGSDQPPVIGPSMALSARRRGLDAGQGIAAAACLGILALSLLTAPRLAALGLMHGFWLLFLIAALWRVAAVAISRLPAALPAPPPDLPPYAVIAALRHEAAMAPQLVDRLSRLDYPADRLRGFLVIEADDGDTIAAARACPRPDWLSVLVAPPGDPMTKPRALNVALSRIGEGLVTVYDAEDEPDPGQLREAAARFASGGARLACLQAPLRIRPPADPARRRPFLDRQFAAEYAALFEVILPAMARLGLPFPLGGTSNHFRVDVLRQIGGWDPWNVTEDADLGFRLWRCGWRLGVMSAPTWETPPGGLDAWLPQRARWLKGFMQTWLVHMRRPLALGWRGLLSLHLTLGVALVSAAVHAFALMLVVALSLGALSAGLWPAAPPMALLVLVVGAASSWLAARVGSRRAGMTYSLSDMLAAPLYWSMLSLAFAHALWRLIRQPFAWDKTPHTPDDPGDHHRTGRQAA